MAFVHQEKQGTRGFDDPLYRLIAETIPNLVWSTDAGGAAGYFNARLLGYAGKSAAERIEALLKAI